MVYFILMGVLGLAAGTWLMRWPRRKSDQVEPVAVTIELQKWRRRIDGAEAHTYTCRCRKCQQRAAMRRAS